MTFQAAAILAAALLCTGVAPLRATTLVSYSYGDWVEGTSGTVQDADFTHILTFDYSATGYTSSDGFTITGPDGSGTYLQGLTYQGYQSLQSGSDPSAQIVVTTPSGGETALMFLLGNNPQSSGYSLVLSDGETFNLPGTTSIFGVSVSHPITSATIASTGSSVILQDVTYGNTNLPLDSIGTPAGGSGTDDPPGATDPSAVPEATTMLLLGGGLLMVAFARKRTYAG